MKILILTRHETHKPSNSVYGLARALTARPEVHNVFAASLDHPANRDFMHRKTISATPVDHDFSFQPHHPVFLSRSVETSISGFDFIWLRVPPPLDKDFLDKLCRIFPKDRILNHPDGIRKTSGKDFLLEIKEVCPPIQLIRSVPDLIGFKKRFPIVLKPLNEYGGKGIIRIDGDKVWIGNDTVQLFSSFVYGLRGRPLNYLGMKYLKNVSKGDKRIIVVNGEIIGASLRLPPEGNWLCNASQGGSSHASEVTKEEREIIERISPILLKEGIVMFGADTLEDDSGKRVLSEVNTLSVGGVVPLEEHTGLPLSEKVAKGIAEFMKQKLHATSI